VLGLSLLVTLEAGLRLAGFNRAPVDLPLIVWNQAEDALLSEHSYLFQSDLRTLWSPRAGARIPYPELVEEERINESGYRGPLVERERVPGALRIVTLGDSSTFGVGVPYGSTYSAQLAAELKAAPNGAATLVEVIDGGVDGFTIIQGLQRYRHFARKFRPDIVVVAFGAVNEHWPALDGIGDAEKLETQAHRAQVFQRFQRGVRRHSRLAQALHLMIDPQWQKRLTDRYARMRKDMRAAGDSGSGQDDWPGRRRVSLGEFTSALDVFAREVAADRSRLILIANPRRKDAELGFPVLSRYTETLLEAAHRNGVQILDARSRFHRELERGANEDELFIGDLWHPNSRGHASIARWLVPMVLDKTRRVGLDPLDD